jgi:uncharacterized protein DUF2800
MRASETHMVSESTESMKAALEPAHSPFGGSVAGRILHCRASVGLVAKVPAHLRRTSTYADRGTALHAAMASLIERQCSLDDLVDKTIGNHTITRDDVESFLRPVLAHVDALLDQPTAEYFLEQRVQFPTVAGSFGTLDLIVRIGATVHVEDFKFGVLPVPALYPDGDDDVINAQPLFYAAAARHSLPKFFAGVKNIVLAIVQPRSVEPDAEMVSSVTVTHAELDEFTTRFREACDEAQSPTPRLERGDWCRFCPATPICPAHTGPLLDLAQFVVPTAAPPSTDAYLQVLADGLDLVNAIKDIRTALHDQAKAALENGDQVPGYALSAGRAERHWHDENTAIDALIRLGFAHEDLIAEALRSPRQVELRAKARGLKVPTELIVSTRSGTSLTRVENAHAPVPGRGAIAQSFSAALEILRKGERDHGQS